MLAVAAAVCMAHADLARAADVVCRTVDGTELRGTLAQLQHDHAVIKTAEGEFVAVADTLVLELEQPSMRETAGSEWVLLGNGDRLAVTDLSIDGDFLTGRMAHFSEWPRLMIPMESIVGGVTDRGGTERRLSHWLHRIARHSRAADIAWLANGDRIAGELLSLVDGDYSLETAVGPVSIAPDQSRAFSLDPSLMQIPEPSETSAVVTFTDGSWIEARRIGSADGATVALDLRIGMRLTVELRDVSRIRFAGPRAVPLHEIGAPKHTGTAYLGGPTKIADHRNAHGNFLSLRGREYPRGLGVTSGTRLTFRLDGDFSQFSAIVGIDDDAEGGGSVVFGVEGDGRRIWSSPVVTGRDAPVDVPRLDIAGVEELTLLVEFGEWGDVRDLADWCLPTLWR